MPGPAALLLCVLTSVLIGSGGAPITCEAGTYVAGKASSVTCYFRQDVSNVQRTINIARYSPDAKKGAIGTDVLECYWSDEKQKHDCTTKEGYKFDGGITDRITVGIPNTTDSFAGLYRCFFVPPLDADSHACDFFVTVNSTDEDQIFESDISILLLIGLPTFVAVVIIGIILFFCWYRWCKKERSGENQPLIKPKDKQIERRLEGFGLPPKRLAKLMQTVEEALGTPPTESTSSKENIFMRQLSFSLSEKTGPKDILVVDFGCNHIQVSKVTMRDHGVSAHAQICNVPDKKKSSVTEVFNFIAESVNTFAFDNLKNVKNIDIAVIVPFPCNQTCLNKARIAELTREFCCEGALVTDVQDLLQTALARKKTKIQTEVVAIVNDAVSTLVSLAYEHPECRICVNIGSGFNACFVDNWRRAGTGDAEEAQSEMVNVTELGSLRLDEYRTEFDRELDESSSKTGSQIFEKMVSWTYVGEMVRVVLRKLKQEELFLTSVPLGCALFQEGSLTSDVVAQIQRDTQSPHTETTEILKHLGVEQCEEEDLSTIRYVCRLICDRAAKLVAAALATLINRVDQPGVIVVVDGEMNRKLPRFGELLYHTANQLVKPGLKDKFYLVSSFGRRNVGAARIAEAAPRQGQATATLSQDKPTAALPQDLPSATAPQSTTTDKDKSSATSGSKKKRKLSWKKLL